jgi:hypothetical protein
MQFDLSMPSQLSAALGPDLLLIGGSMLLLLWAGWRPESDAHQRSVGILSMALCILTMVAVGYYAYKGYTATVGPIAVDNFRWAADEIFLIATLGTLAMSLDYNVREGITPGETHVLLLLATSGMMILAAARDLIIVFLGIELMSIAVYLLVGINRRRERSAEGAIKYSARRLLDRVPAVRNRPRLWGHRCDQLRRDQDQHRPVQSRAQRPAAGWNRADSGWTWLQGRRGTIPHVGARCAGAPTPITAYMAAAVKRPPSPLSSVSGSTHFRICCSSGTRLFGGWRH